MPAANRLVARLGSPRSTAAVASAKGNGLETFLTIRADASLAPEPPSRQGSDGAVRTDARARGRPVPGRRGPRAGRRDGRGGRRAAEITADTRGRSTRCARARLTVSPSAPARSSDRGTAEAFAEAGAAFLVSPGAVAGVAAAARERGIPSILGALTPTEVAAALAAGANAVKVFPASARRRRVPAGAARSVRRRRVRADRRDRGRRDRLLVDAGRPPWGSAPRSWGASRRGTRRRSRLAERVARAVAHAESMNTAPGVPDVVALGETMLSLVAVGAPLAEARELLVTHGGAESNACVGRREARPASRLGEPAGRRPAGRPGRGRARAGRPGSSLGATRSLAPRPG